MASKHQQFVACVEKIKSIKLQILLDAELSAFYVSVYKISKRNIDCDWLNVAGSDLCSPAQRPDDASSPSVQSLSSYLLVLLHIVAQTDQTGLELLGHQGPAVVLRSAKHPMTEHRIVRMKQS